LHTLRKDDVIAAGTLCCFAHHAAQNYPYGCGMSVIGWLERRGLLAPRPAAAPVVVSQASPPARAMSGKYRLLYKYLQERYADRIVMTFSEVEDVLGFTLPDEAHRDEAWWLPVSGTGTSNHADAWIFASRFATPNVPARIVVFERMP
jgi:hypothetical protein